MEQLKNKVAVITGGSKGIGLATAQMFANEGAKVVITGRDVSSLNKAKENISGEILAIPCDTKNISEIEQSFRKINKHYGKIDVLFVNAGISQQAGLNEVTEEIFDRMDNINYKGAYFTVQKSVPYLNDGASIILNASVAALIGVENHSVYASTKAAVVQLARSFATELAARNIRVNAISPGYIKTPIWGDFIDDKSDSYKLLCDRVPLGRRFGSAEEIASVVLFLASDAASYITAQNIVIDGGLSAVIR